MTLQYAWVPEFLDDPEIEAYFLSFPVEKVGLCSIDLGLLE